MISDIDHLGHSAIYHRQKIRFPTRRMARAWHQISRDNIIRADRGGHTNNRDSRGITISQECKRQHLRPILIRSQVHSHSPDAVVAKVVRLGVLASRPFWSSSRYSLGLRSQKL